MKKKKIETFLGKLKLQKKLQKKLKKKILSENRIIYYIIYLLLVCFFFSCSLFTEQITFQILEDLKDYHGVKKNSR